MCLTSCRGATATGGAATLPLAGVRAIGPQPYRRARTQVCHTGAPTPLFNVAFFSPATILSVRQESLPGSGWSFFPRTLTSGRMRQRPGCSQRAVSEASFCSVLTPGVRLWWAVMGVARSPLCAACPHPGPPFSECHLETSFPSHHIPFIKLPGVCTFFLTS